MSARRTLPLRDRLRGPWRIVVAEASMLPAIAPGDWLLVDPTIAHWPRPGSVVVFRDPETDELSIKRVAGGPGATVPFAEGFLRLGPDEAWLLSDADEGLTAAAGFGAPIDSHRFGPVPVELLVGRAWFRYGPIGRIGRIPRGRADATPSVAAGGSPPVTGDAGPAIAVPEPVVPGGTGEPLRTGEA